MISLGDVIRELLFDNIRYRFWNLWVGLIDLRGIKVIELIWEELFYDGL